MLGGEGKGNAVLAQVVAQGDLAAEAVAAGRQPHLVEIVFLGLYQHRHVQAGETQGFRHRFFITKVRQQHHHTVNTIAMGTKQLGADFRILTGFDAAQFGLAGIEHHGVDPQAAKQGNCLLACLCHQIAREKSAVTDDHAHCELLRNSGHCFFLQ